jgi:8-oxo-dGTP diphosphatase
MLLKNNEQCSVCGRFANRGISIDAVVIRDGKILLIKRGADPFKGYWGNAGGYVDWDESVEDAVRREVKEEVNADVVGLKLIGVYSSTKRHPKQVISVAYLVRIDGKVKAGDDAVDARWFSLSELPDEMAFDHLKIIADAKKLI